MVQHNICYLVISVFMNPFWSIPPYAPVITLSAFIIFFFINFEFSVLVKSGICYLISLFVQLNTNR